MVSLPRWYPCNSFGLIEYKLKIKLHDSEGNSFQKGRKIKRWAQKMSYECPGSLCNHIKFAQLDSKKIAFGHIVSQQWARSFTFLLDKKDHPDNLYLTCQKCNSSLGDKFPDALLRMEIEKRGTIGDWLRKHIEIIRNS